MKQHLIESIIEKEITEDINDNIFNPDYMGEVEIKIECELNSNNMPILPEDQSILLSDDKIVTVFGPNIRARGANGEWLFLREVDEGQEYQKFLTSGVAKEYGART